MRLRFSLRRLAILVVTALALACLTLAFDLFFAVNGDQYVHYTFSDKAYLKSDLLIRSQLHHLAYEYSHYRNFTKHVPDDFESQALSQKCEAFFKFTEENSPDWQFDLLKDANFEKWAVNKAAYFKDRSHQALASKKKTDRTHPELNKNELATINAGFLASVEDTKAVSRTMADTIALMRIYGQCFVNADPQTSREVLLGDANKGFFDGFTSKLFHFLTPTTPIFERFDGTIVDDGLPIFSNGKYSGQRHHFSEMNIVDYVRTHSNGKGIVISARSSHGRDIVKLIRVLRALNNELPIQIVHRGDLTKKNRNYIWFAARAEPDELLDPTGNGDYRSILPEINLQEQYAEYGSTFRKQELWFVDVKRLIPRQNKGLFEGYLNKILALIFNLFEEVLLMDADLVPLVKPLAFFQTSEYKASGTMFFRDRAIRDANDYVETNFFTLLMPTRNASMDGLFGIRPITNHTLSNPYLTGWRHSMEAGIVPIHKTQHFMGLLMTIPLALWVNPVKSSIWGDKEMYWLGLSMAGDENYRFNKYGAASIGVATEDRSLKNYANSSAVEVCSTHPGHVGSDDKLLWINLGFSYCKKNGYFRDKAHFPFLEIELPVLRQLYHDPVRIKQALIPPELPLLRPFGSPIDITSEQNFIKSWKERPRDLDEIPKGQPKGQILNQDPQKSWIKSPICQGYNYCAYDSIASYKQGEKLDSLGRFLTFSKDDTRMFDYLAKVWITGIPKSRAPGDAKKLAEKAPEREVEKSPFQDDPKSSNKGVQDEPPATEEGASLIAALSRLAEPQISLPSGLVELEQQQGKTREQRPPVGGN